MYCNFKISNYQTNDKKMSPKQTKHAYEQNFFLFPELRIIKLQKGTINWLYSCLFFVNFQN